MDAQLESLAIEQLEPAFFCGVLRGRYVALLDGCAMYDLDRRNVVTPVPRNDWSIPTLQEKLAQVDIGAAVKRLTKKSTGLPILTTPYGTNYFHMTLECMSSLRHVGKAHQAIGIPSGLACRPYQLELLSHCLRNRHLQILDGTELHIDPIVFYDNYSYEGVDFLRNCVNNYAAPGTDIVFFDRKAPISRKKSGSIRETEDLAQLIERLSIRRINFGGGELSLTEQIRKMDGAKTIIAAHGAAMTNLIYLNRPVNVIEIVTRTWSERLIFEDIANHLGFNYHRFVCTTVDESGDMIVNTAELEELVRRIA